MIRPRWFTVVDQRTISRFAHLFETDREAPGAGDARTACGVYPFERMRLGEITFAVAGDNDERCPKCLSTQEVSIVQ